MSSIQDVIEEFRKEGYSEFMLEVGPGFDSHPIELARENKEVAVIALDTIKVEQLIKNALNLDESWATTITFTSPRPQEEKMRMIIEMLSRAREFLAEHDKHVNLKYVQDDIRVIKKRGVAPGTFNSIYINLVLLQPSFFDKGIWRDHLVEQILEELSKMLKPGGFIEISEMFGATDNAKKYYAFVTNALKKLGLEVGEVDPITTYGHYLAYLKQKDIAMDELFKRIRATKKET